MALIEQPNDIYNFMIGLRLFYTRTIRRVKRWLNTIEQPPYIISERTNLYLTRPGKTARCLTINIPKLVGAPTTSAVKMLRL